jgi:hypothetical protein
MAQVNMMTLILRSQGSEEGMALPVGGSIEPVLGDGGTDRPKVCKELAATAHHLSPDEG